MISRRFGCSSRIVARSSALAHRSQIPDPQANMLVATAATLVECTVAVLGSVVLALLVVAIASSYEARAALIEYATSVPHKCSRGERVTCFDMLWLCFAGFLLVLHLLVFMQCSQWLG